VYGWTIELIEDLSWKKIVASVERKVAGRLGALGYMRRWASLVQSRENEILEIAKAAMSEEDEPCCRLLWPRGDRHYRFVAGAPTTLRPDHRDGFDPGGTQSVDDIATTPGWTEALEKQTAQVLEVPTEEPNVDLRVSGGAGG
jgi:hypothetical protein